MTSLPSFRYVAIFFVVLAGCAQHRWHDDDATSRHAFSNVEQWVAAFDDPGREAWQKPGQVVQALGLRPGQVVADLGAGTGYFLRHLATAVGEQGTVFAVDTEPNLVAHLRQRAESERLSNVVPVLASADNPRLPPDAVDLVLIVDTVHHIDDRVSYLRQMRSHLRPAGRIAIVDWKKQDLPVGPPLDHKLAREQVVRELEAAGFGLVAELDFLPYQYFLIFAPR